MRFKHTAGENWNAAVRSTYLGWFVFDSVGERFLHGNEVFSMTRDGLANGVAQICHVAASAYLRSCCVSIIRLLRRNGMRMYVTRGVKESLKFPLRSSSRRTNAERTGEMIYACRCQIFRERSSRLHNWRNLWELCSCPYNYFLWFYFTHHNDTNSTLNN